MRCTLDVGFRGDTAGSSVRDYAYLKWRYADHPSGDYRALLVRSEGSLVAVGIYRSKDRWAAFRRLPWAGRRPGVENEADRRFHAQVTPVEVIER